MNSSNNLGDQIKDVVQDAMDSMNFRDLNMKIQRSVNGALHEVKRAVDPNPNKSNKDHNPSGQQPFYQREFYNRKANEWNSMNAMKRSKEESINKPLGKVSGIVMTVLGIIGMVGFGIAALVMYMVAEFVNTYFVFGKLITLFMTLFVGMSFLFLKGRSLNKRTKRFMVYQDKLRKNNYFEISEVAKQLGKPNKYVVNDLYRMIRLGMFPQGHLDEKQTCFIGDDNTYEQYRLTQLSYEERRKKQEEDKLKEANASEEEKAVQRVKSLGADYVEQVREANVIIEDEVTSQKLDRLELIIKKIFDHVVRYPEQLPEIRRFMDYYLPITLKLVNVYKDLEHQPIQSTNIKTSRKEIEDSLDTINDAFEKLFDGLYENVAMEVATDINVLNTLLAQEGLTKKDFDVR